LERSWSGAGAELEQSRSGSGAEPEPAKFRSKEAGIGAIKGKWPDPESELRSFEILAPEQEPEPLKFSRLHQPWFKVLKYGSCVNEMTKKI